MASTDMTVGITERLVYGAVIAATAKMVEKGYITTDMQLYIAGGGVAAFGALYAWWNNRPGRLLDRAAAQLPVNAKLVITAAPDASRLEKDEVHILARAAGEKVVSKEAVI